MTYELLVAIGTMFVATALLAGSVTTLLVGGRSQARRRLDELAGTAPGPTAPAQSLLVDQPDAAVQRFSRFIPKSPAEMTRVQRRLVRAGYHQPAAPVVYVLLELVLPLAMGGVFLLVLHGRPAFVGAAFGALVGYLVPGFVLAWKAEKRKTAIGNGLPDLLDLLVVCVEAGMGLDQAIQKASEELDITHPALTEELRMISTEMRAGKPRLEAFRNFAERTKVEDVRSLVAMLIQTDRFGTSVSQALRTFADTLRTKRRQRAEERAAKLGVKLVFPLVFCLFPALYVVTLGPAVIQFIRVFFGQVAAH